MSRFNQLPNLRVEDFQSEQDWIGRLFVQLNPFIQAVANQFEGNLDFGTNIKAISKTYDATVFQPFTFLWPFTDAAPQDVRVIKASKGAQFSPTILLCAWSYDATNQTISITRITEVLEQSVASLSGRYQYTIRATV